MPPTVAPVNRAAATPVRYDYLDALRGWAVLGVVATHSAVHAGSGSAGIYTAHICRYGVQLFFVVSAFTIFLTLDRAREQAPPDWTGFFIRRFFRVLPMFWAGLMLYAFVPGRDPEYAAIHYTPLDYALTALLQHGWHPSLVNAMVPGGWSIAAEGTFYLVVPLCYRFVRSWQGAVWLLLGSLALSEAANRLFGLAYTRHLVFAEVSRPAAGSFGYAWLPTQFPVFACGILAYYLVRALERRPVNPATGAALLAVAGMTLFTAVGFGKHGWLLEHVCFALGFVPLVLGLKVLPTRLLVNPATRFLGRISYSVYLLHFAVLLLALNSLDTLLPPEWQRSLPAFLLLSAATLAGTSGLAWLTYRYVERPCIDLGSRLARRLATVRRHGASGSREAWHAAPTASLSADQTPQSFSAPTRHVRCS